MPLAPSGPTVNSRAGLAAPPTRSQPFAPAAPSASTARSAAPSGPRLPTARVAAARSRYAQDGQASMSKPQLLVALYERLVRDLAGAEAALDGRDLETVSKNLQHAQDIVLALEEALDQNTWAAAEQLGSLYRYLYGRLLQANVNKDPAIVRECRSLVEPLVEAWREAALTVAAGTAASLDSTDTAAAIGVVA